MKDDFIKSIKDPFEQIERSQQELERRIFHLKSLYDLSQEVGFLRGTQEIVKNLLMMTIGTFGASCGFIFLLEPEKGEMEAFTQRGMRKDSHDAILKMKGIEWLQELDKLTGIQVLNEGDSIRKQGQKIYDILSFCNIRIWIPLTINENLRGGIGLGDKISGDPYERDDQELLSTMVNQGNVAIENALLVEQMKKEESVRANLARYLSPQVVEQIIRKNVQVNLGGDRRVVTVLFSDIRNFTRISESMPPDKLVHLLNEYFTEMAKIIFENQGSLDKYIGDAIVAVFGSLIPLENSAQSAVQAAIQMMRKMAILNERWRNFYGFPIEIGIGINAGEVFLGNIGSPERMEFTIIGDTVNIASRFSDIAKAGQILITKETLASLGSGIKYEELTPTEVKGKTGKLDVFEIIY